MGLQKRQKLIKSEITFPRTGGQRYRCVKAFFKTPGANYKKNFPDMQIQSTDFVITRWPAGFTAADCVLVPLMNLLGFFKIIFQNHCQKYVFSSKYIQKYIFPGNNHCAAPGLHKCGEVKVFYRKLWKYIINNMLIFWKKNISFWPAAAVSFTTTYLWPSASLQEFHWLKKKCNSAKPAVLVILVFCFSDMIKVWSYAECSWGYQKIQLHDWKWE